MGKRVKVITEFVKSARKAEKRVELFKRFFKTALRVDKGVKFIKEILQDRQLGR